MEETSKGEVSEYKTFRVLARASRPGAFVVLVDQDSDIRVRACVSLYTLFETGMKIQFAFCKTHRQKYKAKKLHGFCIPFFSTWQYNCPLNFAYSLVF